VQYKPTRELEVVLRLIEESGVQEVALQPKG
jgi:hypothetical protein